MKTIKDMLLKRREELVLEIDRRSKSTTEVAQQDIGDIVDSVSEERTRELDMILTDREKKKLAQIEKLMKDEAFVNMAKRERLMVSREKAKLEKLLGGIADLNRLPARLRPLVRPNVVDGRPGARVGVGQRRHTGTGRGTRGRARTSPRRRRWDRRYPPG